MAAITDLSDPLRDEELERLQTILLDRVDEDAVTDGKDEGVLDVSELDGLLTAVVSGPVTIVPSRWLPAVWGDFEPTWHSVDDYGAFMSMLMRHMNSIAETLIEAPEAFEPMYLEHVWKGKAVLVVDEWCEGYMRGVGLAADEWRAGAPEIADLLAPIRAFTAATDWQASCPNPRPRSSAMPLRPTSGRSTLTGSRGARRRRGASRGKRVRCCAWDATSRARAAVARSTRNAVCSDRTPSSRGDPPQQELRHTASDEPGRFMRRAP